MKAEIFLLSTISPALRIMSHTENGQKYVLNEAINEWINQSMRDKWMNETEMKNGTKIIEIYGQREFMYIESLVQCLKHIIAQ